jgi:hypothetical protein
MLKLLPSLLLILVFAGCGKTVEIADPTPETTPWLYPEQNIEQLASSDFKARAIAARNLGKMGAKAKDAIPELEKLVAEDGNEKVREMAAAALEKIHAAVAEE